MKQWNVPGVALAIAKDGKLLLARGYGYADFEAKTPVQPDSIFRVASISKILTAVSIMHLKDQGQLDLEQKVVDILTHYPPGTGADPRVRDITIRHLLQHSGGWDSAVGGDPAFQSNKIAQALGVANPVKSSDLTRYMMNQTLQFTPGSRYGYSNAGYTILGRVIEKISGQSYESYVREQVLAGFGIHAMSLGKTRASERGQFEVKYYPQSNEAMQDSDFPGDGRVSPPYATYIARFDSAGAWIDTRHSELPLLAQSAMITALGTGFTGSSTDLYAQYLSPGLPASGQ